MKDKRYAVVMMIFSSFSFALMGVFVKLSGDIPVMEKAVFRTIIVSIISFFVLKKKYETLPRIVNYKWLFIRCFFGTLGIVLNYYALDHLILSDASIIFRLSTIFVLILSFIFLKEKLDVDHIIPIIIGFIGLFIVVRPSFTSSLENYLVAIIGAISASIAYMSLRVLGKTDNSHMIVFSFSMFSSVVLLPLVIYNFEPLTSNQMIYLVLAGIFAAGGQYGITLAYKYAPAKEISIYNYTGVIFSGILGIFFFSSYPSIISMIGYMVIFYASYRLYRITKEQIINK